MADGADRPRAQPWHPRATGHADALATERGVRLRLREASAAALASATLANSPGPASWRPPLRLRLRARWSHPEGSLIGSSGFGLWNECWRPGGSSRPPSWLRFVHYSKRSRMDLGSTACGLHAAALAARRLEQGGLNRADVVAHPLKAWGTVAPSGPDIQAGSIRLWHDTRRWHECALIWTPRDVTFALDGVALGQVPVAPPEPLTFVAWMDNQWLDLRPDGALWSGFLAVTGDQWLQLEGISIEPSEGP